MKQRSPSPKVRVLPKSPVMQRSVIIILVVVAITLLIFFLYPRKISVGQAFYAQEIGSAGIVEPSSLSAGQPFSVRVRSNIGDADTISAAFELRLPMQLSCDDVTAVDSELDWQEGADSALISTTAQCVDDVIIFEYSTLDADEALTGEIDIADIYVAGIEAGLYAFNFEYVEILDLEGVDRIDDSDVADADLLVTSVASSPGNSGQTASSSGSSEGSSEGSSGSVSNNCIPRWSCTEWNDCVNGRQRRQCVDARACGTTLQRPALEQNCSDSSSVNGSFIQGVENIPPGIQQPAGTLKLKGSWWQRYALYLGGFLLVFIVVAVLFWQAHLSKRTKKK